MDDQQIGHTRSLLRIVGDGGCEVGHCFLAFLEQFVRRVGHQDATLYVRIRFRHFLSWIAERFDTGTWVVGNDAMANGKRFAKLEVENVGQMLGELKLLRLVLTDRNFGSSLKLTKLNFMRMIC